jgi:uncharacterized membrane protein HdeD (DUF308 family)
MRNNYLGHPEPALVLGGFLIVIGVIWLLTEDPKRMGILCVLVGIAAVCQGCRLLRRRARATSTPEPERPLDENGVDF